MRRLIAVVLVAVVATVLVAAHPAAQEVSSDSELDDETARKIIGSSVVTSVSVILNGQEPAHFSDAAGRPVPRPLVPPQVASPINLLNPDRYEFYTFNDNGDLIKRLMTVKEIQSIVAGGASEGNMMSHHPSQLETQKIENNVEDIVSNVQRVLNGEVDASAKRNVSDNHKLDTPDVSETWSQILPAIFGNTGEVVGPQPKPPQNIAMTTDAVLMLETSTPKINSQSNSPNGIRKEEINKRQPIEVSTPRSNFKKPDQMPVSGGGYRQKTTEAPTTSSYVTKRATTIGLATITEATATTLPAKDKTTPSEITLSYDLQDADKLVTSFYVDTNTLPTEQSVYSTENSVTSNTDDAKTSNESTSQITQHTTLSTVNTEIKTESNPIVPLNKTNDHNVINTQVVISTPDPIVHKIISTNSITPIVYTTPILLETHTPVSIQDKIVTNTNPIELIATTIRSVPLQEDILKKPAQSPAYSVQIQNTIVQTHKHDIPVTILTSTEKSFETTATPSHLQEKPLEIATTSSNELPTTNDMLPSTPSANTDLKIDSLTPVKISSTTYITSEISETPTIAPKESDLTQNLEETATETMNTNDFSHTEPMHDSIQKLSAALLAESHEIFTDATVTDLEESPQTTETPAITTGYVETFDEATEAVFDSDFSFNQIMESLKDSTDAIGLLLANDENLSQFVPATTEIVTDKPSDVIKQHSFKSEEAASQNPSNLYVDESEPQVFDIPTTTQPLVQDIDDFTTIEPNDIPMEIHSVVQQVNKLIDSTTLSQIPDQVAVESVTSNQQVHIPIEHGIKMSEYVEKAATVASVIKQRPIVTADKSVRTSEDTNVAEANGDGEKVKYETSVVRETSSVSVSSQTSPIRKPTLVINTDNHNDISTEISVQSDVHEEFSVADKHPTTDVHDDDELNIAAEILNPIGFFDEEVLRNRFNELGDQVEHREDSTEISLADDDDSKSITTEDSGSYTEEGSKSTATTSEESGSSEQSSTESSQEFESNSVSSEKESVEGVQEGVAAVNDVINSAIAGANEAAIDAALEEASRDVTTDSSQISATTENEFPDSRTIWPATTDEVLLDEITETNTLENQSTVSEETAIPAKLDSEIPISNKLTSEQDDQSSSVESSSESYNAVDSSEESTTSVNSFAQNDASTESSDEESTTRISTNSNDDIIINTEEEMKDSNEPDLSTEFDNISFSSTESLERGTDSEDTSTSSTSSDEQSTELLNRSSSADDLANLSSESRLGVEYRKQSLDELTGDDSEKTTSQNQINEDADQSSSDSTATETDDITTVPSFYQSDEPLAGTTISNENDKLEETTAAFPTLDETTLASDTESTEKNINSIDFVQNPINSTVEEISDANSTPIAEFPTESSFATQSPKDEQVFINLGETTVSTPSKENIDAVQTSAPPRKNLPETQHAIQTKKQAAKIAENAPQTDAPPSVTEIPHKMAPVKISPPAHIKMPPAFSSFKIKGSQASRKPAMSVKLDPAPNQALGLEESTANVSEDILAFTRLCNELAFTFWRSLTSEGISSARSLVVSPFALSSMLAMVFLGARGSTSGEMNELLRLDDMVTFNPHLIFRNITDSVENPKEAQLANSAFVRALFSDRNRGKILPFFKEKVQQYYSGHVEEVNFNFINDIVRRRTNLLVKRHTFGKISEYLRTNNVWLNAPLASLSANIFQTDCSNAFVNERDGEMFFQVLPAIRQRRLIPIPAVVWKSGFTAGYDPELDATAVAFGDASNVVSTIFIMPGQQGHAAPGDNLERLELALMQDAITKNVWKRMLTTLMERPGLEVQIPRFSHRSFVNATHGLQKMGLQNLFDFENADLRGLTGSKANDLYLSDMVQINTFSTCGEEKISDQHHVEMYPAPPIQHRNINNYETDEGDGKAQETARTQSIETEYDELRQFGADEDRALDYPLFDEEYLGLPLPLRPRQARIPEAPRLRFDKPFLFFVRHNPTGMILYMGRFNPRLLP